MKQSKIVQELFRSRNPFNTLLALKKLGYRESRKKITQAINFPIARKVLFHDVSLPQSYSKLRETKQLDSSNNIEGELAWLVTSLLNYKDEINLFLEFEGILQSHILLGQFIESKEIINLINKRICFSYWAIDILFSVEQKINGSSGNWNLLKELNTKTESAYSMLFYKYYSNKSEDDTSILQYKRNLENLISGLRGDEVEYIVFKLGGYLFSEKYSQYEKIISLECPSSIIDKYILLIEILTELSCNQKHNFLINQVLNDLNESGINDKRIDRLREINNLSDTKFLGFNEDILLLNDMYSSGYYSESQEYSKVLLNKFPESIEIYEIYVKSLIELRQDFKETKVSPFIDYILKNMYSIYNKNLDYNDSKENLLKVYLSFPRINFFKQLLSVVTTITNYEHSSILILNYFVNSNNSNPQIKLVNETSGKLLFDDKLLNEHLCVRINDFIFKNNSELLHKENIPEDKLKIFDARIKYFHSEKIDFNILDNLRTNERYSNYFKEISIYLLNKSFIRNEEYDKLVSLVVDSYFLNEFFINRLNITFLLNYIIDNDYKLDSITIDLPIFFRISSANDYFLYAGLDLYLSSISIKKPSQLSGIKKNKKLIYLLYKICTIDVLNNFYMIYENESEVIEERIKVLRILTEIDVEKSSDYLEEIASISQKQKINKIIQTVNDGKISLNFSRIKEAKEYNLENSFNRFLQFKNYSDKNELTLIDEMELVKMYLNELTSDSSKLQNASFLSFKALFFEVVDYFLFSKEHGLDGDLSTRIRHGVLENQIRSIFSKNKLIAIKDSNNDYKDVEYWNILGLEKSHRVELIVKVQNRLKVFSSNIDSQVNSIVQEYVQIQSNRHTAKKSGMFNYRFTEEYLWILYKEVTDTIDNYDDFLNYVFDILTVITEKSLTNMKTFLQIDVNCNFQNIINELQEDINNILYGSGEVWLELNQKMNFGKTQIESELYNVSKWFKIVNNIDDSLLDIETIIQTAVESINIHTSNKILPTLNIEENNFFEKGFYYIDIFKILIGNAIGHSKLDSTKLNLNINVNSTLDKSMGSFSKLLIEIENDLSENVDKEKLREKLNWTVKNWKSDLSLVNNEGGSGFQKIKRLLRYDIRVYDNSLSFELKDSKLLIKLEIVNFYKLLNEK